jgi:hydroxymethylglutaryl-CoA reductase
MTKIGHVHFVWQGKDFEFLQTAFVDHKQRLFDATEEITRNMRQRGGGILDISLIDKSDLEEDYYQLQVKFDTRDSMGANFINSCLEAIAKEWAQIVGELRAEHPVQIVMSILSNFTPECVVRAEVSCKIEDINEWLSLTKWSQKPLQEKVLNKIQNQLFDLKIIDKKGTFAEIVKAV